MGSPRRGRRQPPDVQPERARLHGAGTLAQIEQLAAVEAVPPNFLAQILGSLRDGGVVTSKRGIQGGYEHDFPSRLMLGLEADLSFANYADQNQILAYRASNNGTATGIVWSRCISICVISRHLLSILFYYLKVKSI